MSGGIPHVGDGIGSIAGRDECEAEAVEAESAGPSPRTPHPDRPSRPEEITLPAPHRMPPKKLGVMLVRRGSSASSCGDRGCGHWSPAA